MNEIETKREQMRALLQSRGLDALLLQRVSSFAWATGGQASYVNTASSDGIGSVLLTPSGNYIITNTIEAPRLDKEYRLKDQGWEIKIAPWHQANTIAADLTRGMKVGADMPFPGAVDLAGEISAMRSGLLPVEQERFRHLGRLCAEAMDAAIRSVKPGQSEDEIAAVLGFEAQRRGAQAIVNLIATDERIYAYRHPLPVSKKLERYAMLVLCGRQQGLVCSITRLVYFGSLPAELRHKMEACARIDGALIAATRPGAALADVFRKGTDAYAAEGFADEWQLHHQGGPAAYEPRETTVTPASTGKVLLGEAFAWNPSITGVKSEDTILTGEKSNEVITVIPGWPVMDVVVGGQIYKRPLILEIN